ncbi:MULTISPECIES: LysR family transcriptional regulator [unclassified Caballeronia]|uniref:LysR family transcriptional regulator n=1 Tax=unclassified Caballeronia TaxID=2646786 RepID=UPI002027861B|nr:MULTISPECIES: LysR family transcriptional regulator [unclassified Caballeronia]MDR5765882.1 LysR family transcriptional regulator [Caballeronia sp. LZ028]
MTDLKVFVAVAEEGNVSRGAERCHLAPSSASLRVKNLEDAVGVTLLSRHPRGVALTAAGQVLVEHARRCLAQLEQMRSDLLPFAQGMTGHVTVFANNNAISSHLPDDLARFFAAFPSVRITLEERLSHDIVGAVVAGRADVGVVALESEHPALRFVPYKQDQLVLLTPVTHVLAKQSPVSFKGCLGQPFISLQSGAALHTFLMNHASALDGRLDVRVQVSGYRAIARLVSSGAGIGIVPRTAIEASDEGKVAVIELLEPWSQRNLHVCFQRNPAEKNLYRDELVDILCQPSK